MAFLRARAVAAARHVEHWFFDPADARAYAAMRITYSVAALAVLVDLWPLRHALFAQSGLVGGALGTGGRTSLLNVFNVAGSDGAVTLVLCAAALALCLLALGVFVRGCAIIAYLWTLSYCATVPVALGGFDTILRVVGFVVVISPAVTRWTMRPSSKEQDAPAYGLRLAQWQLMLVYASTVWLKAPDPFWRNGETVAYLMLSMFSRAPDPVFAHLGALGALLTYGTLLIEASVPFLLWMRKTRWLGLFLGLSMHLFIALVAKLMLFSLAMLPLYCAFLERSDFEKFRGFLRRAEDA